MKHQDAPRRRTFLPKSHGTTSHGWSWVVSLVWRDHLHLWSLVCYWKCPKSLGFRPPIAMSRPQLQDLAAWQRSINFWRARFTDIVDPLKMSCELKSVHPSHPRYKVKLPTHSESSLDMFWLGEWTNCIKLPQPKPCPPQQMRQLREGFGGANLQVRQPGHRQRWGRLQGWMLDDFSVSQIAIVALKYPTSMSHNIHVQLELQFWRNAAKFCGIPIWVLLSRLVSSDGKESSRLFRSCGEKRQIAVANHLRYLRCTMMHNNDQQIRSNYGSSNTLLGEHTDEIWWNQSSDPTRIQQQKNHGNRPGKIWSPATNSRNDSQKWDYTPKPGCFRDYTVDVLQRIHRVSYQLCFGALEFEHIQFKFWWVAPQTKMESKKNAPPANTSENIMDTTLMLSEGSDQLVTPCAGGWSSTPVSRVRLEVLSSGLPIWPKKSVAFWWS